MRENTIAGLALAVVLGVSLAACQDTKTRQENEQLKARMSELEKDNGDLQNRIDALTQENADLKQENERLKAKKTRTKKTARHKHRTSSRANREEAGQTSSAFPACVVLPGSNVPCPSGGRE
jgi:DNA repair exonuclease SbcCD ATPase subunit